MERLLPDSPTLHALQPLVSGIFTDMANFLWSISKGQLQLQLASMVLNVRAHLAASYLVLILSVKRLLLSDRLLCFFCTWPFCSNSAVRLCEYS